MTSIGTLRELDQAVEEAFEPPRVCELAYVRCAIPADWWHIYGCCGAVVAKCSLHKYGVWSDGQPAGPPEPGDECLCPRCGVEDDGMQDRWEPIR